MAASLAAAFCYALYVLMAERSLERGRDVYSLLAWGFVFAAAFWTVAQPWWSFPGHVLGRDASLLGRVADLHAPVWLLLAYIVVLGTIVPFILLITALHYIPATRATVVAMIEPAAGLLPATDMPTQASVLAAFSRPPVVVIPSRDATGSAPARMQFLIWW